MGWSSGSEVAEGVWKAIEPLLEGASEEKVEQVARELAELFRDHDCDTLHEVEGPLGDAACRIGLEKWFYAPRHPQVGDEFVTAYDETYVFNGRRWVNKNGE